MKKVINGIQQIGIGVSDAKAVFNWYRKHLGFDILVFEDESTANLMTQYTDGQPSERIALLAMNMTGGAGLEIWQFKNRKPQPPLNNKILLGDLGINGMKVRSNTVNRIHEKLKQETLGFCSDITVKTDKKQHFFFKDPWSNLIEIVEDSYVFSHCNKPAGGVMGVLIGVSDMETSINFYSDILGYDEIVSDETGTFKDLHHLDGGECTFRRTLVKSGKRAIGGFGELLGPTQIELIQVLNRKPSKIYQDRLWGDLGYIHICFDIQGMNELRVECREKGFPFTVDSTNSFNMGNAAGHFSYIEDPDGTLIEFVETHRVPLVKSLGLYINLKKRKINKPLPKWIIKAMTIHRKKKDLL